MYKDYDSMTDEEVALLAQQGGCFLRGCVFDNKKSPENPRQNLEKID